LVGRRPLLLRGDGDLLRRIGGLLDLDDDLVKRAGGALRELFALVDLLLRLLGGHDQ
jgi:hypothetical protein